jgi:hypothetical protein
VAATLRLGDTGAEVKKLQQALIEAGMPATSDPSGVFGPGTRAAVLDYQSKSHLTPDGIVGPKTWAALDGQATHAAAGIPAPDYARMSALMAAAVALADGDWRRGVHENAGNRNRGPEVDQYLIGRHVDGKAMLCYATYVNDYSQVPECGWCKKDHSKPTPECFGAPWCARAALYWIQSAAAGFSTPDPTRANGAGDLAGASKWIRWAKRANRLVGAGVLKDEKPRAGDVMVISTPGHGHVMLAANVIGDKIATREGNASQRVNAHWRDVASISAWIRVG